jgi:hypothetical protein
MIFTPQDSGPWYLSVQQREAHRKDLAIGKYRSVKRSKKLLVKALSETGVDMTKKEDTQGKSCKRLLGFMALTLEEKQGVIVLNNSNSVSQNTALPLTVLTLFPW